MSQTIEDFISLWEKAIAADEFLTLTLADPKSKKKDRPVKQMVRAVTIQDELLLQWEYRLDRKTKHKNLSMVDSAARLRKLFGEVYRESYLYTTTADFSARASKKGVHVRERPPSRTEDGTPKEHNRQKHYLIQEGRPCPFLEALDVMGPSGYVKKSKQKKFRQINRYLELVNDIYDQLPKEGTIRVIDFGCGLSYLTFSLHHLLTVVHKRNVDLIGVDQNSQVIERCRSIAKTLELNGLTFINSSISEQAPRNDVHLVISLHACDTATDDALAFGVSVDANVVLAAPCCQHELNTKIEATSLKTITQHGILKERFSAMATDALRVAAMEAVGYRSQIIEFIEMEHTPKNLLIRAVKRDKKDGTLQPYTELKALLGVEELATDRILSIEVAPITAVAPKPKIVEQPKVEKQPAPVPEGKPVVEVIPVVEEKMVVEPKPVVEKEPVVEAEPVIEPKPVVEQPPTPAPEEKPAPEPKPVVDSPWSTIPGSKSVPKAKETSAETPPPADTPSPEEEKPAKRSPWDRS